MRMIGMILHTIGYIQITWSLNQSQARRGTETTASQHKIFETYTKDHIYIINSQMIVMASEGCLAQRNSIFQ